MKTVSIHPADLNTGDTILINGVMKTVGKNTVKTGYFGTLVDGERLNTVEQVLFPKWFKGEITGYYAQI
jgi:hypothetical protein